MVTLLVIIALAVMIIVIAGLLAGIVAVAPVILVIFCLPVLDFLVYKVIKWIRKKKD